MINYQPPKKQHSFVLTDNKDHQTMNELFHFRQKKTSRVLTTHLSSLLKENPFTKYVFGQFLVARYTGYLQLFYL